MLNTLWHKYFFTAITIAIILTPSIASTPGSSRAPAPAFRPVLSALIGHTTIPILLPSWLPEESTGRWADSFADADSYDVWLPNKSEHFGNAPHNWHTVEAQRVGPKTPPVEGVPIALSGGRVGYYLASEWAARPSPAAVTWTQKGVQYAVTEYNGSKEDVVRIANSMVVVGGGLPPLLRRALPQLRATEVRPVLLPTYLPPLEGFLWGRHDIKPDMDVMAGPDYYLVAFSSRPDVDEADLAYFEAEVRDQHTGVLPGSPVTLWMPNPTLNGHRRMPVRGGYRAVDPKNSASTAIICWDLGKMRYTLIWLGGSRSQMIRMAESCVPVTFSAKARKQTRAEMP